MTPNNSCRHICVLVSIIGLHAPRLQGPERLPPDSVRWIGYVICGVDMSSRPGVWLPLLAEVLLLLVAIPYLGLPIEMGMQGMKPAFAAFKTPPVRAM